MLIPMVIIRTFFNYIESAMNAEIGSIMKLFF